MKANQSANRPLVISDSWSRRPAADLQARAVIAGIATRFSQAWDLNLVYAKRFDLVVVEGLEREGQGVGLLEIYE